MAGWLERSGQNVVRTIPTEKRSNSDLPPTSDECQEPRAESGRAKSRELRAGEPRAESRRAKGQK